MAGSGGVLLEVDGGVAIVARNAPDRRTALTPTMAAQPIATFDEVDSRADVGALGVLAVGQSFCAGGDIATLTSAGANSDAPEACEGMGDFRKGVINGAVGWDVARQYERPAQMWPMRRG